MQSTGVCSGDGLVPDKEAIAWTNADQHVRRHMTSQVHKQ